MEEQTTVKKRGILGWLEEHGPLLLGIFAAIAAGYYLLTSSKSSGTTSALSLPQSTGGGGSSGGGATPTTDPTATPLPANIVLPFNPDFSVLGSIADEALRRLYEQEYNLEASINAATAAGNTSLVGQLTTSLTNLQNQIAGYVPAVVTPTTPDSPATATWLTPTNNTADAWQQALGSIWDNFQGSANNTADSGTFGQGWINTVAQTFKVPAQVAQDVYDQIIGNPKAFQSGVNGSGNPIWDNQKIANALNGAALNYNVAIGAVNPTTTGKAKSAAAVTGRLAKGR